MGVLLQAFYQIGNEGIPTAPHGGMTGSWWDHLARQAAALRRAGFTAIWLPPVTKGASGKASVGYDVFDDYDIGSKDQKGAVATRYGTREQLARCVAVMRSSGLDVYADLVENQRGGGSGPGGFTFRYADADGVVGGGRFPKDPDDFHPNVPQDPNVPGPDFSFGADLAPINGGRPAGSVADQLIDSADWLTRSLDLQGYRIDDVKGQSSDFLRRFLNSKSMAGKFAVAEYFDGNIQKVQDWIFRQMQGRASAFDFSLRFILANMCDSRPFNMATLDHAGLAGMNPFQAVTFVENHDTDRSEPVMQNKMLAYAYILTSEGYPCVFYKDYSTDQFCYGLKSHIDKLLFVHEHLADGPTLQRFKDFDVFAYERLGGNHLLVGLNNAANAARTVTVFTSFGSNVELQDYVGHSANVRTDGAGRATITIPPNVDGLGYVCYSRTGVGRPAASQKHAATQMFEGAQDLDIKPATPGTAVQIGRVFCETGTLIPGVLTFDDRDFTASTRLTLELFDAAGSKLAGTIFGKGDQGRKVEAVATTTGFHAFAISASETPETNAKPRYELDVTYQAPKTVGLH
jgi:alpha-amylase